MKSLLQTLTVGTAMMAMVWSARAETLYVAPGGNDAWTGKITKPNTEANDGPLASLAGARDKIRELRKAGSKDAMTVFVREGTYVLSEPFILEPQDSGAHDAPVLYSAFQGEHPVISGGKKITGWTRGENGNWSAKIDPAAIHYFRQLFVNGERRTRARTPNEGFFSLAGRVAQEKSDPRNNRAFVFNPGDIKDWHDPETEIIPIHSWETSRLRIKSVDAATNTVEFTGPAAWPFTNWDERQRYYVENAPDSLDAPGEWRCDPAKGTLEYMPLPGEKLDEMDNLSGVGGNGTNGAIVPQARQFVLFKGNSEQGQFVENITLSGLTFRYADWDLPEAGYSDAQAAYSVPAVIEMYGARQCAIERCEIAHIGTYAIRVRQGSKDNRIERNHIHDLGAGGICIGEITIPKEEKDAVARTLVRNNYIHHGGNVYESGIGVWIGQSSDNTITHNEISDFGYTGVSAGWTLGYDQSASQRNIIEYNHIHHIGNEILSDMGGIYTLGFSAGSILRYNHIHHVLSYSYGGWGIYPDEGTSHMLIENNVVHHTKTGGFHQHYGKENLVINNIFAFSLTDQIVRSRVEDHRSFRFERNIVYFDQGDLLGSQWGGDHFFLDHNLYWRTDGADMDFKGSSLADWRKEKNMDWNSIVADPLFKNPEHPEERDFKMSGESPARKIGFEEIDMSGIGLEGERAWRKLPDQFQTHRQKWPEPPPPMEVNEDFEQIGVGQTMPFGTTSGETAEASIRVTDETAAQGKHSLKFTDAANLSREFNPHFYFDPGLRSGVARENFDLKFEAGETVYHEWRTEGGSYVAGPTITIRADGALLIGGEKKMDLPADTWIHFEIECGLGTSAKAVYTVTVNVEGSEPAAFKDIPCDARFRSLRWVGFCSMATEKKLFYLDNLKLRSVPAVR